MCCSPAYISTVDSGNLAGHLIALKQACREIIETTPDPQTPIRALAAALAITQETFADAASSGRVGDPGRWQAVSKAAALMKQARSELADTPTDAAVEHVARALAEADRTLTVAGLTGQRGVAPARVARLERTARRAPRHRARAVRCRRVVSA